MAADSPQSCGRFCDHHVHTTNADGTTSEMTKQKEFVIGAPNAKESGIEADKSTATLGIPRKRRFWHQENAR